MIDLTKEEMQSLLRLTEEHFGPDAHLPTKIRESLLARYRQPLFERIDAALIKSGMQRTFKCCDVNHIKFCSTDTYKGNLEAFARALLNEPIRSL